MNFVLLGQRVGLRISPPASSLSLLRNASVYTSSQDKLFSDAPPPYVQKSNTDWIGPPDKVSHIRPVHFPAVEGETERRRDYRLAVEDAASWNHQFWHKRNSEFFAERKQFVRSSLQRARIAQAQRRNDNDNDNDNEVTSAVSTEEMSDFYGDFCSRNEKEHQEYVKGWYARNYRVLKTGLLWFLSEMKMLRG